MVGKIGCAREWRLQVLMSCYQCELMDPYALLEHGSFDGKLMVRKAESHDACNIRAPSPIACCSDIQDVNDSPCAQTKKVDVDFVYGAFGAPMEARGTSQ